LTQSEKISNSDITYSRHSIGSHLEVFTLDPGFFDSFHPRSEQMDWLADQLEDSKAAVKLIHYSDDWHPANEDEMEIYTKNVLQLRLLLQEYIEGSKSKDILIVFENHLCKGEKVVQDGDLDDEVEEWDKFEQGKFRNRIWQICNGNVGEPGRARSGWIFKMIGGEVWMIRIGEEEI